MSPLFIFIPQLKEIGETLNIFLCSYWIDGWLWRKYADVKVKIDSIWARQAEVFEYVKNIVAEKVKSLMECLSKAEE